MKPGRGYLPNSAERRAARAEYSAYLGTPDQALDLVAIAADVAPAWDQGQTGSCTGHGTSDGVCLAFAGAGAPLAFRPSPAEIYRNGRAIDRLIIEGQPVAPLADEGAQPSAVILAANTVGMRPTRAADGLSSDADPATINDEPQVLDVETERQVVPVGEYAIRSVAEGASIADVVASVRAALAQRLPVGIAANADGPFQDYTDGVYTPPADVPPPDHWISLIAYRTNATGGAEFLLKNSWGAEWGASVTVGGKTLEGVMWASEAFLATCEDLTVYVPRKAA